MTLRARPLAVAAAVLTLLMTGCGDSSGTAVQTAESPVMLDAEPPPPPVRVTTTTERTAEPDPEPTAEVVEAPGEWWEELDPGLFCRDVHALGGSYADAVAYWTSEGRPARMDATGDGIPCTTV
jgi:hypothetical protein